MSLAAVDEQQIRERGKMLVPVQIALEAAGNRLVHAGIVVRPVQVPDAEFAVVPLQGLAVHVHAHGGYDPAVPQV